MNIANQVSFVNGETYGIIKELGSGEQGYVYEIKNSFEVSFALKIVKINSEEQYNNFVREIGLIKNIKHKNIVKIFMAGKAILQDGKWLLFDDFSTVSDHCFYLMEYIKGKNLKDLFNKPHNYEHVRLFESLIHQVSKAISFYRQQDIVHKDIKKENIIYSSTDDNFIIVDFGFAHKSSEQPDKNTIPRREILDVASLMSQVYDKHDMGQFSRLLLNIYSEIKDLYTNSEQREGIEKVLQKARSETLDHRYSNMDEFLDQVSVFLHYGNNWKLKIKSGQCLTSNGFGCFTAKIRIPVYGSIQCTDEVLEIVNTKEFQRLRGVRQLGPTIFVYPGANHTRFEHSLGVYYLSLRFLEKLSDNKDFIFNYATNDSFFKMCVLSALLHDIGHYPYSHWIEEIDKFPNGVLIKKHEDRAVDVIKSSNINSLIVNKWYIGVDDVGRIIKSEHANHLLNSVLSSIIDVDKLDYLIRDSVHCGVDYGKGIDLDRLIDSITLDPNSKTLCFSDKGTSSMLSVLSIRNIMYQDVYWHKTVRSCEAMFKRVFYEYIGYISTHCPNYETILAKIFNKSDDEFIAEISKTITKMKNPKLDKMLSMFRFQGREFLYKPAFIYYKNCHESPSISKYFANIFHLTYQEILNENKKLTESLNRDHNLNLGEYDLLIEKTPVKENEYTSIRDYQIFNTRKKKYENLPSIFESINDYLKKNRKAYIFVNPEHYNSIKAILNDDDKFEKLLT